MSETPGRVCDDFYCPVVGRHFVSHSRCVADEDTLTRVVIHLDVDCFFAQVEERADPSLRSKPMGVQQNMEVAAVNYPARAYGLYNRISVAEAQKLCPQLVLVRGDNAVNGMQRYRSASHGVLRVVMQCLDTILPAPQQHSWVGRPVETPSFDDVFVDFTRQMAAVWEAPSSPNPANLKFPDPNSLSINNNPNTGLFLFQ